MNINELYIKEIKESLVHGHAAVLIGSGFSRNAERIDGTDSCMPDWFGLADAFCEKLGINERDKKYADSLALAQEVEEIYGRPFLDDMLRNLMSDEDYLPSGLHKDLLNLPWTDVFTTNYDTLLERTYQYITEYKYHIVVNQKDLINSSGTARIVKLHGSFPSNGPFIITEEDFRTYPYDHAPFVNTMQQSLLENTFILIGFSGNDPNFLKWIGWIHDNLGIKNSPKIFLISHDGESILNTKVLMAKNIEVIALNNIEKYKDDSYKNALGKLLSDLVYDVNKLRNGRLQWPGIADYHQEHNNGQQLLKTLENIHAAYPGWIMAKFDTHQSIKYILSDVEYFMATTKGELGNELKICYEYCWLNHKMGCPLFQNQISNIIKILEQNKKYSNEKLFWEIQLCILYSYRIHGCEMEWEKLYTELVEKNEIVNGEISVLLAYEKAMHLIYTLQWQELETAVDLINVDKQHEKWILKKCGLLAMLGRYEEAKNILKDCLFHIRRIMLQNKEKKENAGYISIESCMVYLYNYIKQAHKLASGDTLCNNNQGTGKQDTSKEIDEQQPMAYYGNDFIWQIENEEFTAFLSDNYIYMPRERKVFSFDIGGVTSNISLGQDLNVLTAYEFISFRELTGIPFQIGMVANKVGVRGAVLRINHYDFKVPLILSLLSADKKIIEAGLNRFHLHLIDVNNIDLFCDRCISLMRFSMNYYLNRKHISYFETNLLEYPLKVIPEILSRLCVKCSEKMFRALLELLIDIYKYEYKAVLSDIKNLIQRVIQNMPIAEVTRNMDRFWEFDLMPENDLLNSEFPDPFYFIGMRLINKNFNLLPMNERQNKIYDELLEKTKEAQYHFTAISKVAYIYKLYEFSEEQKMKFKYILWDKGNLNDFGLPHIGNFYCVVADEFPHDEDDKVILGKAELFLVSQFKDIITKGYITNFINLFSMADLVVENTEITEGKAKKAIEIALSLCNLFDQNNKGPFEFSDARNGLNHIDRILGKIILYSDLANIEKSYHDDDVNKIIKILDDNNIPHTLLTWCTVDTNRDHSIIQSVFNGDAKFASNANQAVYVLTKQGISISEELKETLIYSVYTTLSYQVNFFVVGLEYLVSSDLLNEKQCSNISESLPKFDKITELVETDMEEVVSKKLVTRKVTSMLAHSLYVWYENKNIAMPKGILYWKELSKSHNEFAEIRLCWE